MVAPNVGILAREDQSAVIALLSTPTTYGNAVRSVERIDTHSAIVFLAGDRAYKLKRAVRFDYLDFSALASRRAACTAEVRLNRRTAPAVYLGVRPVTRKTDGSLTLDGQGTPVDWVVEMARFDQATLLDRLAERQMLDPNLMPALAHAVTRLHAIAQWRFDHGGRRGMAWVIHGNADGFAEYGRRMLDSEACARLTARSRAVLDQQAALLDFRRLSGFVRWCHGDLHLRNVCLVDGKPTLFDCVEFNEEIACVDVLYDLAFLLMDLLHRRLRLHANMLFNEYMAQPGDIGGLALLPLFLSCRAAVRAKTSATAARVQVDRVQAAALAREARQYLEMAQALLDPVPARVVTVGGLSGTGKSTLARRLAPAVGAAPGALILRSDLIRKSLLGILPLERLGPEGYTDSITREVYRRLSERAAAAVKAGHAVIVDAVFANPLDRGVMADAARDAGVRFTGLWLDADRETLAARLRHRTNDPSDATPEVLRRQLARDVGGVLWHRVDASVGEAAVQRSAENILARERCELWRPDSASAGELTSTTAAGGPP